MSEETKGNEPKQDRVGNDYHEGSNPNPGGTIDTGDSLVPPYEDRAKGDSDTQEAKSESVRRQLRGEDAPEDSDPETLVGPTGGKEGQEPPAGVGENVARPRPGHDRTSRQGGRTPCTLGTDASDAGRPTGESTERIAVA